MRKRISFEDAVSHGLIAVGKPFPRTIVEGFKYRNFGDAVRKREELLKEILDFVERVSQSHQDGLEDIDHAVDLWNFSIEAEELLKEIENA